MGGNFHDRVTIYLAIETTDSEPSILTERLGVHPDRQWSIGDVRRKTGKHWGCHGWVMETTVCSEEGGDRPADELIPIAMERFERRVGPVAKLVSSSAMSAQKYMVLSILAEDTPGIELSHSFLQLLADLGGTFQIDLSTRLPDS